MNRSIKTGLFFLLLSVLMTLSAFSEGAWDVVFPIPPENPLWQKVKDIWNHHWDGKNIDDLIGVLHQIETASGDTITVDLWLSRAYFLKSRYEKKGRVENVKKAESYAAKAVALDADNMTALKLLITTVSSYADLPYIEKTYGPIFVNKLPVPVGRALPLLDDVPAFMAALPDWDNRGDIEKGKKAVAEFKRIADEHPDNLIAQTWVCRGNYYLGYYYLSRRDDDASLPFFEQGNDYGLRALAIDPHNVPANYWRQLNLARSIQNANILVKARYLHTIMDHLVLTANENTTYFYCGPLISTATIIEKGGWLAERGLGLAGYTMDTVTMGLELAVRAFPTYFYTHFARAEVLYHLGRKDEAEAVLRHILEMDPYQNPFHAPENICVQGLTRTFLAEHFSE